MYDMSAVRTSGKGCLLVTASFYKAERDLFRAGLDAYNALIWKALDNRLTAEGAIGPFKHYEIPSDGNVSPFVLVSEET